MLKSPAGSILPYAALLSKTENPICRAAGRSFTSNLHSDLTLQSPKTGKKWRFTSITNGNIVGYLNRKSQY